MRVLLLHPEDNFPLSGSGRKWDLVVDFGHAAVSTHETWSQQAGCRVLSIFGFAEDVDDLYRTKELLLFGMDQVVDRFGIDWWDVLSVMITPSLLQLSMVRRLAKELEPDCDLYMSRPMPEAWVLGKTLGVRLTNLESRFHSAFRRIRHYFREIAELDSSLLAQVVRDKFDSQRVIRRRLTRPKPSSTQPMVLLPSAYANVSRTAVSYAAMLPNDQFLLVYARAIAELRSLPSNVSTASLDGYFSRNQPREIAFLLRSWSALRKRLTSGHDEFASAETAGLLKRFSEFLPWGISVRDAWNRLLDSENIVGCLSADDGNPYTRIPLILAKKRGIPALACHHGALDYAMAIRKQHADFYLSKSEMERDYLVNICRVPPESIVVAAPASAVPAAQEPAGHCSDKPWLVFFTETSQPPWRGDEVYRDLLPLLVSLANSCGLNLLLKLHPFESRHSYRRWLKRYLPPEMGRQVNVVTGAPSLQLWRNTRFALTVQSSVAVECAVLGIPVFLCAWLREPYGGYVAQYARFGIGHVLQSPEQIADIPRLLEGKITRHPVEGYQARIIDPTTLHNLLHGRYSLGAAPAKAIRF